MSKFKQLQFLLLAVLFCLSCTDEEVIVPLGVYENGFFITNEGNFGTDNAEVTFISNDGQTIKQDVFKSENNGAILGNTLQSMAFYQDKAFLVVNGSNKIEVVNRYTFKRIATINSGLNNPRYIAFANGKGYISNWGVGNNPNDDFVAVLDLNNYVVSSTITIGEGPEKILSNNDKLYVALKGGFNNNNKVVVINSLNNTIENTILTGDNPCELHIYNNNLHVFCSGKTVYDVNWNIIEQTGGSFRSYDLINYNETIRANFPIHIQPRIYYAFENTLYYVYDNYIRKRSIVSDGFNLEIIFEHHCQTPYGIFVNNQGRYFISDAKNYNLRGDIRLMHQGGDNLSIYTVGIAPNGFYENK